MAIRSKDEIMTQLQTIIGEDTSDETLTFIQDVSDTLANENSAERIKELETQLETQDKEWRAKYRDAFFTGKPDESLNEPEDDGKPSKFEDLFKIG